MTATGDLTSGSNTIANVATGCGSFAVGQRIEGSGIPNETTISAIGLETLTLSKNATSTTAGVQLSASFVFTGGNDRLAFNQESGRLYVLDSGFSGTKKIYAFNSPSLSGGIAGFPLAVSSGPGFSSDIAVDNTLSPSSTAGRIYYTDRTSRKAYAYNSAGVELTAPGLPNFPVLVSSKEQELCGAAVDSAGNLYVSYEATGGASQNAGKLQKFSPSGVFLGTAVAAVLQGEYGTEQPCDLAFDTNDDLYIAESGNGGHGRVWKYTAASEYSHEAAVEIDPGTPGIGSKVTAIAVDTSRDLLLAARSKGVYVYSTIDGSLITKFAGGISSPEGVTVDQASSTAYVSNFWDGKVYAFGYVPTADVTGGFADTLTGTSAALHATVNPQGVAVSDCYFQYTTATDYEQHGFTAASSASCAVDPGSVSKEVDVAANIGGLSVATDYRFRFIVRNANGTSTGSVASFATRGPLVRGTPPTSVTDTTATLSAEINPNGEATSYRFQYVRLADFEVSGYASAQTVPASAVGIGGGNAYITASFAISGLVPDSGYRYRVLATNVSAAVNGPTTGFATYRSQPTSCSNTIFHTGIAADLPDCRAYEQVSPIAKNGYDLDQNGMVYSTPDGTAVVYGSGLAAFGDSPSAPRFSVKASERTGESWGTTSLTPPIEPVAGVISNLTGIVVGVSEDLSKQLISTNAKLTPDAVERLTNLYIHDSDTDTYELIATTSSASTAFMRGFIGLTNDGTHAYFSTVNGADSVGTLDSSPAPLPGASTYAYEFSEGALKLVGVLPGGGVASGDVNSAYPFTGYGEDGFQGKSMPSSQPVSADGERIYWQQPSGSYLGGGFSPIYLRENGVSTLVSERESDNSARNARFWKATPEGVAFMTSAARLTGDASAAGDDLYRYDPDTDEMVDLTPSIEPAGARVRNVLGISKDGSYVYFIARGVLDDGALAGANNMYVWHDGDIRLLGTLASKVSEVAWGSGSGAENVDIRATTFWRTSPNGRYFGFLFGGKLNGPHPQQAHPFKVAYLYDYRGDSLVCASCPTTGEPTADPGLQRPPSEETLFRTGQGGMTRNVNDLGQFFFDTTDALVPQDTNARRDVYEYEAGQAHLISSGQGDDDSFLGDASASGNDVFFYTRDGLVGQDVDPNIDLYVARVNGGLSSQLSGAQGSGCQGDACQNQFTAPLSGIGAGSAAFAGAGDPTPKHGGKAKKRKKKHKKHGRKGKKRANRHQGRAANDNRRAAR